MVAYACSGLVLGTVAAIVALPDARGITPWISIAAAAALLAMATTRHGPGALPGLQRMLAPLLRGASRLQPERRAALLAAATPLLPCGVLWAAYAMALASGSPLLGAASMATFAVASSPLLLLAQLPLGLVRGRLGAAGVARLQRLALLAAAAVLAWRGVAPLFAAGAADPACCTG